MDDPLEQAYWEFDARHKGYGRWREMPQSERDAFKAAVIGYERAVQAIRDHRMLATVRDELADIRRELETPAPLVRMRWPFRFSGFWRRVWQR